MKEYCGKELIGMLSGLFGPSGCEGNVSDFIVSQIEDYCDAYCVDRAGNLIVKICANAPSSDVEKNRKRVMICAHMDEVGVMVRDFSEDGYVKFATVGHIDPRVLCGRGVVMGDEDKKILGIVASKAIHIQSAEERRHATPVSKMNIDIGAVSEEEARAALDIGDVGVFDSEFITFGKDGRYLKGKALDGRIPCAIMIEIIRELKERAVKLTSDLYFAFSCCEEITFSATRVAAQSIRPDVAIVLDSVEAGDAEAGEPGCSVKLGEGVALSFVDRGTIYDRQLVDMIINESQNAEVKYQIKRTANGKTGGLHIQRSCEGVRVASIAVPVRYMHTASCVADSEDCGALKNLVYRLISAGKL